MKISTSNNYRQRISRVIDYIYQHLDRDLNVNILAEVAMMSPYHFHRIYRQLAQENVNATIRRLRLQRSAAELTRSNLPISSIAKKVSYGSIEAFSRAFTKQFGMTPSQFRDEKRADNARCDEPFIAMLPIEQEVYTDMYNVKVENINSIDVRGYHHQGDYMEIGQVFEKMFMEAATNGLMSESTRSLGLYYDDPKTVAKDELRSVACLSIDAGVQIPEGMMPERIEIPAGKYACLLFKGSYAELHKGYDWLFGQWLPQSGHEAADFPVFEEYLNNPKDTPPAELLTRIHCLLA